MPPRSLGYRFLDKAQAALIAAIEIYNKPSHEYREEAFALLAINAWELLLKARVLQVSNNDLRSILVYSTRKKKSGVPSTKKYLERNPSGTAKTISLQKCINRLESDASSNLALEVRNNLLALSEIRDSSAHFITASPVLRGQVLAVSVATVKNFVLLAKAWFDLDLADQLSLVLPLAFLSPGTAVDSVVVNAGEGQLIDYLLRLAKVSQESTSEFDVALRVDVRLKRSNLMSATKVQVVDDPSAMPVVLTEQNILESYPWTFDDLTQQLRKRYSDFSVNNNYHFIRKALAGNIKYAWMRLLDPRNPKGGRKQFFSQAIINEFDKHYTKKN
jgi:Protein of unknown function (DUF3644)/EC042_2821-lke REase